MKTINKIACFTDIHFGRKQNSEVHNTDCLNFIDWFCNNVKKDPDIGAIVFLGDWHEQRSSINSLTLSYSYAAAKKLNDLGLPIYFMIGNHDLYYRDNRNTYSTEVFESLENFVIIDKDPLVVKELGPKGSVIAPFLFHNEYHELVKYFNTPVWFLHAEFKGFVVTGETKTLDHGPDANDFTKPTRIFTGHFHKRQSSNNVMFIGSIMPMDFSDANDFERGMMIYDYTKDDVKFIDWLDCPKYISAKLSDIMEGNAKLLPNSTVRCYVDVDITLDESNKLRESFTKKYKLREFSFEESSDATTTLTDTESDISDIASESVDSIVATLLGRIEESTIKPAKLIQIYKDIKID